MEQLKQFSRVSSHEVHLHWKNKTCNKLKACLFWPKRLAAKLVTVVCEHGLPRTFFFFCSWFYSEYNILTNNLKKGPTCKLQCILEHISLEVQELLFYEKKIQKVELCVFNKYGILFRYASRQMSLASIRSLRHQTISPPSFYILILLEIDYE